jgi:hypothetical protein
LVHDRVIETVLQANAGCALVVDYHPGQSTITQELSWERLMKYVCLVYADENDLHGLPDSPPDAECLAFSERQAEAGRVIGGQALQPIDTATTVRVRGGDTSITDGPFAETREQLAGFYLIEARDLNEAIRFASQVPPARVGSVEIRPVRELEP